MKTFQEIELLSNRGLQHIDSRDQLNTMVLERSNRAYKKRDKKKRRIKNVDQLQTYQIWIKDAVTTALGGLPSPLDELKVQHLRTDDRGLYTRQNIIYESMDKVYVTANLYKPTFVQFSKFPCILLACGHQKEGKHSEEYQFVAQTLVSYGFIVFVIDNFGQGERYSYIKNGVQYVEPLTFEHDHAGYQAALIGDNIARYMVHDLRRAIDYLYTREDIDTSRIGITGNSGGGTLTSLMMILDNRIQAAAPATFITRRDVYQKTGQAQDREQHWFNLASLGFDHEDILLAFAPKPVRLLIADYDFFPIEGTMKTLDIAEKAYAYFKKSDQLNYERFAIEHSYPIEMAESAARFFQKVFQLDAHHRIHHQIDEYCLCTTEGQIAKANPEARFVYDLNLQHFLMIQQKPKLRSLKRLTHYLKDIVYKNRYFDEFQSKRLGVLDETTNYHLEHWTYRSQVDVSSSVLYFKNREQSNAAVLTVWSGGTSNLSKYIEFVQTCLNNNKDVYVLDLSGEGFLKQRDLIWWAKSEETYGSLYKLNDDLFWLGDSLAALRSYEVIQAIQWIKTKTQNPIELHAFGKHSVYAKVACHLSKKTFTYHEYDGFTRYEDWLNQWVYDEKDGWNLLFPGLLKYGDLDLIQCDER